LWLLACEARCPKRPPSSPSGVIEEPRPLWSRPWLQESAVPALCLRNRGRKRPCSLSEKPRSVASAAPQAKDRFRTFRLARLRAIQTPAASSVRAVSGAAQNRACASAHGTGSAQALLACSHRCPRRLQRLVAVPLTTTRPNQPQIWEIDDFRAHGGVSAPSSRLPRRSGHDTAAAPPPRTCQPPAGAAAALKQSQVIENGRSTQGRRLRKKKNRLFRSRPRGC